MHLFKQNFRDLLLLLRYMRVNLDERACLKEAISYDLISVYFLHLYMSEKKKNLTLHIDFGLLS